MNLTCMCMFSRFSHVWLFATPWTVAHQAPLSMGFSRQEYWSGLPCCPPPADLSDPGIEPVSPASPSLQADSLLSGHRRSPEFNIVLSNTSENLVVFFRWFSSKVELIRYRTIYSTFLLCLFRKVVIFSSYLFYTFTLQMILFICFALWGIA